jgi:hypothetical protein
MIVSNRTFLEAMFVDAAPGTHTVVCSFRGDPYGGERSKWAGRPWAPGQRLPSWFDDGNTYTTISTFEADPETGERRRRKCSFHSLMAVMVDDIGTKVEARRLLLQPSALIETSPSNYQGYLFLKQDVDTRDRELCELLISRMVATGLTSSGADPGMKGVTRYGRLPIGVNAKAKYVVRLAKPFDVRCTHFDPLRRYSVREIADAWRLDLSRPTFDRPSVPVSDEQIARAQESFAALIELLSMLGMYLGKSRGGPWHDIVCPWVEEHTDHAVSGTAIAEPADANAFAGGFRCHHSHGDDLHMAHVKRFVRELEVVAR